MYKAMFALANIAIMILCFTVSGYIEFFLNNRTPGNSYQLKVWIADERRHTSDLEWWNVSSLINSVPHFGITAVLILEE